MTQPIVAKVVEEHRPVVPERPDMSCVVRLGPNREWGRVVPNRGEWVRRPGVFVTFSLPGTRRAELMQRRDELVGELINQMRGAALADKIAAIDAEIAALGEGT